LLYLAPLFSSERSPYFFRSYLLFLIKYDILVLVRVESTTPTKEL
jgi:hypothetical protein